MYDSILLRILEFVRYYITFYSECFFTLYFIKLMYQSTLITHLKKSYYNYYMKKKKLKH